MSLRQLTRLASHYLVRYECDQKLQVRTKGHFRCQDETASGKPAAQVYRAVTPPGYYDEYNFPESDSETTSSTPASLSSYSVPLSSGSVSLSSSSVSLSSGSVSLSSSSVPLSSVTCSVSTSVQSTLSSGNSTVNSSTSSCVMSNAITSVSSATSTNAIVTSTPVRPRARLSSDTTFTFQSIRPEQQHTSLQSINSALGIIIRSIDTNTGKLDKKLDQVIGRLDTLSKRQFELEKSVRSLQASQDVLAAGVSQSVRPAPQNSIDDGDLDSVPSEFRISIEELRDIYKCTNGAGNMASHLVKRLFPELFGPAQLRFQYNWYGNGKLKKEPLDSTRKTVVETYVSHFYPEVRSADSWKERVVPKINELLRRSDKKAIAMPERSPTCHDSFSFLGYLNNV